MLRRKKLDQKLLIKKGIIAGLLEVIFIILVASFFIISETLFPASAGSLIFGIIAVLSLLVISAAVSAVLVLGYPAYLFLQKKYKEAIVMLGATLGTMLVIFILVILGEIFIY